MPYQVRSKRSAESIQLNSNEELVIENKIGSQIARTHYNSINIGGIANIISGIFIIWVLYGHVKTSILLEWYAVIVSLSLIDTFWALSFKNTIDNPSQLKKWRIGFYFILAAISLAWGSMGVLFVTNNLHYELYVITFLQVVVLSFCFTSINDFIVALIDITSILLPTIIYRTYLAIYYTLTLGYDPGLNLAISISLFILGSFLLAACYIGSGMVRKFFRLSFVNIVLNQKLENMNKFLEQRVQERTVELENSLKQVTYQATHDLLTDLPNQQLLLEYIDNAVRKSEKKSLFCVILFSINELDKIYDGLGYRIGDFAILTVAKRFKKTLKHDMKFIVTIFRKDTFAIILNPPTEFEDVEKNVNSLFSILDEPIQTSKQSIKLTASVGVSVYPKDGKNVQSLLMNADAAMLYAKKQGGNVLNIYNSDINADLSKQLELASYLHEAIKKSEFILQYQPFMDLNTGKVCGVEALVRWQHPTLGLIPPIKFIPLAETNGIIIPLGEWVLRTACLQAKKWQEMGFKDMKVSVNLSAKQIQKKNIVTVINTILKETNLEPQYLELEMTETEAFQEAMIPVLKQLTELGLALSIDDFGTGYSGLTNLKTFTIDKLKIDKSFVDDLETSSDSREIVAHIIRLSKKINVKVIAEGVETIGQLNFLKEHGCDMIQGYYFSKPLDPDVCTDLLKK